MMMMMMIMVPMMVPMTMMTPSCRSGLYTLFLLALSAGGFQASTAMLPSSACAYVVMVASNFLMTRRYARATLVAVTGVLVSRPSPNGGTFLEGFCGTCGMWMSTPGRECVAWGWGGLGR
jgi:hypothetical protein